MKKIFYLYVAVISAFIIITYSCKKSTVGFLSPYIHYEQDPIQIPKGRPFVSSALNPDGSTMPFTATVIHYYNKATGQIVDSLFNKKFPVQTFTGYIDPKKDTTLQQIESFVKIENLPAVKVLPESGQVSANSGALNLPAGEYQYDLRITNEAGTRIYPKIGDFVLVDTTDYESLTYGAPYDHLFEVGHENITGVAKAPIFTVTRTAAAPNNITLQFLDKNGVPFDPAKNEVVRRPNSGVNPVPPYLQTLQDYTTAYTVTDQAMIFQFPFVPFPLNSLGNNFNIYYRIPTQYFHLDGQPDGKWSLNPRFALQVFLPGSYTVTMQLPDVTHVP